MHAVRYASLGRSEVQGVNAINDDVDTAPSTFNSTPIVRSHDDLHRVRSNGTSPMLPLCSCPEARPSSTSRAGEELGPTERILLVRRRSSGGRPGSLTCAGPSIRTENAVRQFTPSIKNASRRCPESDPLSGAQRPPALARCRVHTCPRSQSRASRLLRCQPRRSRSSCPMTTTSGHWPCPRPGV